MNLYMNGRGLGGLWIHFFVNGSGAKFSWQNCFGGVAVRVVDVACSAA